MDPTNPQSRLQLPFLGKARPGMRVPLLRDLNPELRDAHVTHFPVSKYPEILDMSFNPSPDALDFNKCKIITVNDYKCRIIPEGKVVYHGGGAMRENVEFPLGEQYYFAGVDMLDSDMRTYLSNKDVPLEERVEQLNEYLSSTIKPSYFGPMDTAVLYSEMSEGCGFKGCIGSFRVNKTILALDISHEYNIFKLIYDQPSLIPDVGRRMYLASIYGITDIRRGSIDKFWNMSDPTNPKLHKYTRTTLRNIDAEGIPYKHGEPPYFMIPVLLSIAKHIGCDKALFNAEMPKTIGHNGRTAELIMAKPQKYLERNYQDRNDWQSRANISEILGHGELSKLYESMLEYKTLNIDFHAGDLYEHSVWVALYTQKRLADGFKKFILPGHPVDKWAAKLHAAITSLPGIAGSERSTYILISTFGVVGAFLHDIGKMGGAKIYYDKQSHPRDGYDYLKSSAVLKLKNDDKLDPAKLFDELVEKGNIDKRKKRLFMTFVWGITLFHWDFGNMLRLISTGLDVNRAADQYIEMIRTWWDTTSVGQDFLATFIILLMIVSICDIQGAQVFKNEVGAGNARLGVGIDGLPNGPKIHKGGMKFEQFKIDTLGYDLFSRIAGKVLTQ